MHQEYLFLKTRRLWRDSWCCWVVKYEGKQVLSIWVFQYRKEVSLLTDNLSTILYHSGRGPFKKKKNHWQGFYIPFLKWTSMNNPKTFQEIPLLLWRKLNSFKWNMYWKLCNTYIWPNRFEEFTRPCILLPRSNKHENSQTPLSQTIRTRERVTTQRNNTNNNEDKVQEVEDIGEWQITRERERGLTERQRSFVGDHKNVGI